MDDPPVADAKVVTINVGGKVFATSLFTLIKSPHASMIGAMFSGEFTVAKDANGHVFIDNDGSAFHIVLNYLRHGKLVTTDAELTQLHAQLLLDAEYYCLPELQSAVEERLEILKRKEIARLDAIYSNRATLLKLTTAVTQLKSSGFTELTQEMSRLCTTSEQLKKAFFKEAEGTARSATNFTDALNSLKVSTDQLKKAFKEGTPRSAESTNVLNSVKVAISRTTSAV